MLMAFLHRWASPKHFFELTDRLMPYVAGITVVLMLVGLYGGLFVAPTDFQQGDSYRIMFIHVPAAWMSLFIYVVMASCGAVGLIWRVKLAEVVACASAPIGASFTLLTLVTGSLWGKPMWGTWWVWDARLTSELILLFLYVGYMSLQASFPDPRSAARASAVLALVGIVNIPIIHFSVQWWNTLHQGASVSRMDAPSIDPGMLWPLLMMAAAFKSFYALALLRRVRCELLTRERHTGWVRQYVMEAGYA